MLKLQILSACKYLLYYFQVLRPHRLLIFSICIKVICDRTLLVLLQMARHIICTQFSHTTSSTGGIICGLYYGNTLIIPAPIFDAQKTLDAIQQER